MVRNIGNKTYAMGQKKSDASVKVAYVLKNGKWEQVYEGDFDGLKKFIDKQKKLADKREYRKMVADMCGTSYSVACKDMGIPKL